LVFLWPILEPLLRALPYFIDLEALAGFIPYPYFLGIRLLLASDLVDHITGLNCASVVVNHITGSNTLDRDYFTGL